MKAINRGCGVTPTERLLAELADKAFLKLWSFPNPYVRRGRVTKELCDLLVVFGKHVLIFCDKASQRPPTERTPLMWRRWFSVAIDGNRRQLIRAEKWIRNHEVFLDNECKHRLPFNLPANTEWRVHLIAVANGASAACRIFNKFGSGSLTFDPNISSPDESPFCVGHLNPTGSYIHVWDEASIHAVFDELSTVQDLIDYLEFKEQMIRDDRLITVAGEENLVAFYQLTHEIGLQGQMFATPSLIRIGRRYQVCPALYLEMTNHPAYGELRRRHYELGIWDYIADYLTTLVVEARGKSISGRDATAADLEPGMRYIAAQRRATRTQFSRIIADYARTRSSYPASVLPLLPPEWTGSQEVAFVIVALKAPSKELGIPYEGYVAQRMKFLEVLMEDFLQRHQACARVVGIASEPWDLIMQKNAANYTISFSYAEQNPNWTADQRTSTANRLQGFFTQAPSAS